MENREAFLFKSISYNVILQVFFRVLSFILNAVLLRYVSTELIGVCNFRLALLYTTVMFLSREPFRRALPKLKDAENDWPKFVNTMWLVVPNGIMLSVFFGLIWCCLLEQPNENLVSNYSYSILICCLAFVVELCGEAANLITQMMLLAKQKVIIEAISLLIFHLSFVFLSIFMPQLGALSYAIGRLAYSILFVLTNYAFLLNKNYKINNKQIVLADILPQMGHKLDRVYLDLVKVYYKQSIYKQLLTEGERYLITAFNLLSFSQSGIYDIINNLGSLVARFIFLPIEDASYAYFTNSLKRGVLYKNQANENNKITPKNSYENLIKIVSLIGTIILVYGQSYSQLLLQIYGGDRLGKNDMCVNLLRLHCFYVLLLAINGVTESFFNATMSNHQLETHNKRLIGFSVVFLILTGLFSKLLGIYGFLIANCFNMSIRIFYSSNHIQDVFSGFKYGEEAFQSEKQTYNVYSSYLPDKLVCYLLLFTLLSTKSSEYLFGSFLHLCIGGLFFIVTLFLIYKQEFQLKNFIFKFLKK